MLSQLRQEASPRFDADFCSKFDTQAAIVEKLVHREPTSRFTAVQLLRSGLLPKTLEDEYIEEALRTVANPGTPHFSTLMMRLFSHASDIARDVWNEGGRKLKKQERFAESSQLSEALIRNLLSIFQKRGAVLNNPGVFQSDVRAALGVLLKLFMNSGIGL